MYGGVGFDSTGKNTLFSDLWQYNPSSNAWKNIVPKAGGIQPDARMDVQTWYDAAGKLWLMGGDGTVNKTYQKQDDLWYYDIKTAAWVRVIANSPTEKKSDYSVSASIGSRTGAYTWVDNKGNLWLYGGKNLETPENPTGLLNDMWYFDIKKLSWTLVTANLKKNHKTNEVPLRPSPRLSGASWTDNSDNLYLYGGLGIKESGLGIGGLADMWRYDIKKGSWTLVGLNEQAMKPKNYANFDGESKDNHPGYRIKPTFWKDAIGNFWLYGGQSIVSSELVSHDPAFWYFNIRTGLWALVFINSDDYILGAESVLTTATGELIFINVKRLNKNYKELATNDIFKIKNSKK